MKPTTVRLLSVFAATLVAPTLHAATLVTRFASDPLADGWQIHGTNSLFTWDSTNENLRVTWDSSKPNNLFYLPLGGTITRTNDFLVAFDLVLEDIAVGTTPGKPLTFELAAGLVNLQQATNAGFVRGSGYESPNIVEWDYFPNDENDFGATVATTITSAAHSYADGGFTFPLELATNVTYGIRMTYTAADAVMRSQLTSNGIPVGPLRDTSLGEFFDDFAVDALTVTSYSDEGQYTGYEGSVLAHGMVDNVVFASPLPLGLISQPSAANEVAFLSDTNWSYTLEVRTNSAAWSAAATAPGNGATLTLQDTNPPAGVALYRVRAELQPVDSTEP